MNNTSMNETILKEKDQVNRFRDFDINVFRLLLISMRFFKGTT